MTLLEEMIESEQATVIINDDGDHDRFQHYFSKKDIENNIFFGKPMKALCGKVLERQVDPKGRPVCDTCKYIYENVVQKG
jgi:phosphomannomutase